MSFVWFKDRFEPTNKALKLCNWSLLPAVVALFFSLSSEIIRSLWYANLLPFLDKYPYKPSNLEVFTFFYCLLILSLAYVVLRFVYKVSISEVFNLKVAEFRFILKLCALLAVINLLSIYLLDLNILFNPQKADLSYIKSMDGLHIVLYTFVTILLVPVVEETVFRGLMYGPLYRKVGRIFAIMLSSLIWTHAHFEPSMPSIGIFAVGIWLAWLYDRNGSLIQPIVFHIFKNSWIMFYFFKS